MWRRRTIIFVLLLLSLESVNSFITTTTTTATFSLGRHRRSPSSSSSPAITTTINSQQQWIILQQQQQQQQQLRRTRTSITKRHAVNKRQTVIYDGAEFISLMSCLLLDSENDDDDDEPRNSISNDDDDDDDLIPPLRAGYLTIVTGIPEESDERIVGIEKKIATTENGNNNNGSDDEEDDEDVISLGDGVFVYSDSVAIIPKGVSDYDAISTASAAIGGVSCGMPSVGEGGKVVILGGGDYACFTAKALCQLGVNVTLVTTRPMALKDTPLNPLKDTKVKCTSPTIGEDEVGFCKALGQFDTVIDTLGDEAKFEKVKTYSEGVKKSTIQGVAAKLKRENNCERYISTLTQSQQIVLDEGLFFARDPVLQYQKKMEKQITHETQCRLINPPRNFGSNTLQTLLDNNIIYPVDRNEIGNHKNKKLFVRGCSFPDYGEMEVWPVDSREGAAVRFGFPAIGELTLEEKIEDMMGDTTTTTNGSSSSSSSSSTRPKKQQQTTKSKNPFVTEITSLSDISSTILQPQKTAILLVTAPYCKLCRAIAPSYTRMARISKEEKKQSNLLFTKASTGNDPNGKQLSYSLQIDSVPTVILFRDGERYGTSFGVTKIPNERLDLAVEYLVEGREWDENVFDVVDDEVEGGRRRTKLKQ